MKIINYVLMATICYRSTGVLAAPTSNSQLLAPRQIDTSLDVREFGEPLAYRVYSARDINPHTMELYPRQNYGIGHDDEDYADDIYVPHPVSQPPEPVSKPNSPSYNTASPPPSSGGLFSKIIQHPITQGLIRRPVVQQFIKHPITQRFWQHPLAQKIVGSWFTKGSPA